MLPIKVAFQQTRHLHAGIVAQMAVMKFQCPQTARWQFHHLEDVFFSEVWDSLMARKESGDDTNLLAVHVCLQYVCIYIYICDIQEGHMF